MDAPASPLVLTKLRVPTPRPRVIPRTRLLARLTPDLGTRLVLVCAPAGYGKTTLLAALAQSMLPDGVAVVWYAPDAGDDAPISFGSYLVAGLLQALGPTAELLNAAQLLRSSPEMDLQTILPAVINAVAGRGRQCVLVLDDYHVIGAPAIHSAVAFLIEHLPENMRVVIGSRSDPPLPLARLRGRGQLLEIRAADLRFTAGETALFLNEVMGLDLPPGLVADLEARTEGWVAGLQLAALSLAGRPDREGTVSSFGGSHRYLVEYLLAEVVDRQPAGVQSFLLATSLLERMCGPLCDAMLDRAPADGGPYAEGARPCGREILERLEAGNIFVVPLDDEGTWYRYHHLFRDFLRTRLERTRPDCVGSLHRAASEWYAAHGFLQEAVRHAFETRDWEQAAAAVERHSFTMMVHSEISTIYEWCAGFPEDVMRRHPLLCLQQAWALVLGARRQNRARVEERLRQVEQAAAALEDRQVGSQLADHAATVRSYLAMSPDPAVDPQKQLAAALRRLEACPDEDDIARFSPLLTAVYAHMALQQAGAAYRALGAARQLAMREPLYYGIVETTFEQARLLHSQGQLQRAAEACREGQAEIAALLGQGSTYGPSMGRAEQELPGVGCLDVALGSVLMEQDRLDEAEQRLLHGLDVMGWGAKPPYAQMVACVALFRLRQLQGRAVEGLSFLRRLEETWSDVAFCTQGLRVTQALRTAPDGTSALAEAAAWCQNFADSLGGRAFLPGMGPLGAAEAYYLAYLAWVRCQIATGHTRAARSYVIRQLALARANGLVDRSVELSLLEAQVAWAEGDAAGAWAGLQAALAAAEPAGYLRSFDQGPALNRLLAAAAERGIGRDYIRRILAAIGAPAVSGTGLEGTAARAHILASGERLSERELEVLRLMARGAANDEIAEQLVITVGTVKSHINHILGKLAVHNRTAAVARARELDLPGI